MECIFVPELAENSTEIIIDDIRTAHLRALRIRENDEIMFSNGKGLCAIGILQSLQKSHYKFEIISQYPNFGELPFKSGLALGILSDRNRMEFAVEKAVELGVSDFYPLLSNNSEKEHINALRLRNKSISALQQCKRSKLLTIHQPINVENIIKLTSDYETMILADENGENPEKIKSLNSTLCIVGSEGGFDKSEIELIKTSQKVLIWNLGNRRLRAETSVVAVISQVSSKMSNQSV